MSTSATTTQGSDVLRLPGGTMRFAEAGAERTVVELAADPGFAPTPHIHRLHEELFYVLEGVFDFLVGDEVIRLSTGESLAVPVGVLHDFRNPGPGVARLLGVATPGGLHAYFREIARQFEMNTLSAVALDELRKRFDTDPVALRW